MHYVIVDTNILFNVYFFESIKWRELLELGKCSNCEICIPEYVFDEVIKKYRENIVAMEKKIKELKDGERICKTPYINFEVFDREVIIDNYEKTLSRLLEKNEITRIAYPDTKESVKKLARRYLDNRKPFTEGKISFQDAIIWDSILRFIEQDGFSGEVHFITSNYKDFAKDKECDELHSDLLADVIFTEVNLYKNIKVFLDNNEFAIREAFRDEYPDEYEEMELDKEEHVENVREMIEEYVGSISEFSDNDELDDLVMKSDMLSKHILQQLQKTTFSTTYDYGWGDEPDDEEFNIEQDFTDIEFTSDSKGLVEFTVKADVRHTVVIKNIMYERGDNPSDEYNYETGYRSSFSFGVQVDFDIDKEVFEEEDLQEINICEFIRFSNPIIKTYRNW